MHGLRFHVGWLMILGIAGLLWGCASSSQKERLDHLTVKVSDQESRLTRLQQTVSASETKQRYLADQLEMITTGSGRRVALKESGRSEVRFAFNSYDLSPEAKKSLDGLAESLAKDPDAIIEIRGHTDAVGSREYNYALGELRAETVARYLHKQFQVPLYRMTRISYGEDEPVNPATEREAANRRVDVRVMSSLSDRGSDLP